MSYPPTMIARVTREIKMLTVDPPVGIAAWLNDNVYSAQAQIQGPPDSPYSGGIFYLDVKFPSRYPFEPPAIQFETKIYHPNIDNQGRICLDSLKMPPAGDWQPALNLPQLLSQIRILMSEPNPDDPLMPDINEVFKMDKQQFNSTARKWTKQYAKAKESTNVIGTIKPKEEQTKVVDDSSEEDSSSSSSDESDNEDIKRRKLN